MISTFRSLGKLHIMRVRYELIFKFLNLIVESKKIRLFGIQSCFHLSSQGLPFILLKRVSTCHQTFTDCQIKLFVSNETSLVILIHMCAL